MPKTIISDTSCRIIISKIKELELLRKSYGKITTTSDVADEYGEPLPDWITISELKDKSKQQLLELQIDKAKTTEKTRSMCIDATYRRRYPSLFAQASRPVTYRY